MDLAPKEATERARALLKHAKPEVRASSVSFLARLGDAASGPEILKLLKDENEDVRGRAAMAAGKLGMRDTIPELLKMLDTPGERDREVFQILTGLNVKEAVPKFIECLKGESREWAAPALGRMKAKEAVPGLAAILDEKEDSIKYAAIGALAKIEGR
jgi:HEAT repeat protein